MEQPKSGGGVAPMTIEHSPFLSLFAASGDAEVQAWHGGATDLTEQEQRHKFSCHWNSATTRLHPAPVLNKGQRRDESTSACDRPSWAHGARSPVSPAFC